MSSQPNLKAIVDECILDASGKVGPDIQVTLYRIEARMLVPDNKYSNHLYLVRIVKPEGIAHLVPEQGTLMEHGRFSFNGTDVVSEGTELEVQIIPVGDNTPKA